MLLAGRPTDPTGLTPVAVVTLIAESGHAAPVTRSLAPSKRSLPISLATSLARRAARPFGRCREGRRVERRVRYQRESELSWTRSVLARPGCERVMSCIQCGTCSGTCPLSLYMDFTPRRIVALVREGFRRDALGSQTIWLCASCYGCTAHCPQDIHITDVMFTLKREAIREHLFPKRFPVPVLAQEFYRMVRQRGRISEFWVVLRLMLRTNPLGLFRMARTGLALLRTGRLSVGRQRVKDIDALHRALSGSREVM
jgi:heterodisulfide reductase subunit C